ncbi:MAG TPA: sigma-70 family RNA polymerase sigma factor [Verrucomicrobiae bacterium]|jgi:RNA polymerase sigma factor (sigma-70 family)|nr:sigma-70 family RNA polymerase sigma factor [Verrucomicrobiae bacterium]
MNLTDNRKLLRDYTDRDDEAAFRELVERYIDLVYSAALRRVSGNAVLAEDVTQTVFTDLARKARSLHEVEFLGGWLHRHAGFVASNLLRSEQRRQIREQQAVQMNALLDSPDALWQQLEPVLDETIDALAPSDREAIVLRFFERQDFRSLGTALGISEDAAQKRVSRALDKLRDLLVSRGVTLSLVLLTTFMAGKVVKAAPSGLAGKVAGIALAGVATGTGLSLVFEKLANSLLFKTSFVAIVAIAAVTLLFRNHSASTREMARQGDARAAAVLSPRVQTSAPLVPETMAASAPLASGTPAAVSNLTLTIVSADTEQSVPNVELDYWLWSGSEVQHKHSLRATQHGTCEVPVPDGTTELLLVSQIDGFADTRLEWHPDQGQTIPSQYTLHVARAVPIGGRVLDSAGNPVSGAEIGFNNQVDPAVETRVQADDFAWPFWITAKTDAEGRWQINRISKEAVQSIYGSASHPDYVGSSTIWAGRDPAAEKELLAGTHTFYMGHSVTVRGMVKDESGQPVANAKVLVGNVAESGRREATNQYDGTFSIAGCKPGKNTITAQAKGYAAVTLESECTDASEPVQFVLRKGNVLKLQVVDPDGHPIAKARVWLNTFRPLNNDTKTSVPPVQVDFNGQTDADGLLEWDSAPEGELAFDVSAERFMRSGGINIQADGSEHEITLQPGLTISGTVRDAVTGDPVPQFRLITGWPMWDPPHNVTNSHWSSIDRFWMSFAGGKFQHVYEEPVLMGTPNPGFVFKFEAKGYAPFITRNVLASEKNVQFDVLLTPTPDKAVTVLLPNGEPAAGVAIGLVTPGAGLRLVPGGFASDNNPGGGVVKTDNQGQFQLPPDSTLTRVVAAGSEGFAEATAAELVNQPVIHLQPWGVLQGVYVSNGQPVPDCPLLFEYGGDQYDAISCDFLAFQTKTGSKGEFVFPQVPPGNHQIALLVPENDMGRQVWMHRPLQNVTIQSGKNAILTIGSSNSMTASP